MCEKHSPFAFRAAGKLARDQGTSGKPASKEWGGLKLDPLQAAVYHCGEHQHAVNLLDRLVVIGATIAVIGLIVALFAIVPGIVILLAGVAVAAYGVVKMRQGRAAMATMAPDLPLFPHVRAARVIEHLQGSVDLTESGYRSTAGDVTGTVAFSMTHSDWQERMKLYRRKYRIAEGAPVTFNAGFAMLDGPVGLNFTAAQPLVLDAGTGLWFRGDVSGHDLFAATAGRHEGEWNPTVTYQLQDCRKPKTIPLWIVPSLVPGSDQRTLQIDLHWTPLSDGRGPVIELFDRIELAVPVGWGKHGERRPGQRGDHGPNARGEVPDHRLAAGPAPGSGSQLQPASRAQEPFSNHPFRAADPAAVHAIRTDRGDLRGDRFRRHRYRRVPARRPPRGAAACFVGEDQGDGGLHRRPWSHQIPGRPGGPGREQRR